MAARKHIAVRDHEVLDHFRARQNSKGLVAQIHRVKWSVLLGPAVEGTFGVAAYEREGTNKGKAPRPIREAKVFSAHDIEGGLAILNHVDK